MKNIHIPRLIAIGAVLLIAAMLMAQFILRNTTGSKAAAPRYKVTYTEATPATVSVAGTHTQTFIVQPQDAGYKISAFDLKFIADGTVILQAVSAIPFPNPNNISINTLGTNVSPKLGSITGVIIQPDSRLPPSIAVTVTFTGTEGQGSIYLDETNSQVFGNIAEYKYDFGSADHAQYTFATNAPTDTPGPTQTITPTTSVTPTIPVGTIPAPTINISTSCISAPTSTANMLTINWTNPAANRRITYVDISSDVNFGKIYNKNVTGTTSTTAPDGFNGWGGETGALTLNPNTQYYVRLFTNENGPGQWSSLATFTIPKCQSVTPSPTPISGPKCTYFGVDYPADGTNVSSTANGTCRANNAIGCSILYPNDQAVFVSGVGCLLRTGVCISNGQQYPVDGANVFRRWDNYCEARTTAGCNTLYPNQNRVFDPLTNGCQTTGSSINMNLKVIFQGITKAPADPYNTMKVKVTLQGGPENVNQTQTVTFTADTANRNWNASTSFNAPPGAEYSILIKGPKHLQKKICVANPTESAPGTYHCGQGQITLQSTNDFDFTKIYQFVGDLPEQDGTQNGLIDSYDLSFIRNHLGKMDQTTLSIGDLNADGIVDAQDYALMLNSLLVKYDDQ